MGNLNPSQMFAHTLVTVKGPPRLNRLDFHAAPAAAAAIAPGSVCMLNSSGNFITATSLLLRGITGVRPMPMFAIQDTNAFDANSDVNNMSGGVQSAIVATGGFEVESTEFVAGSYPPNSLLTASSAGGSEGKLTLAAASPYGEVSIVGCVSTGFATNHNGISALRFWTMFLPAGTNL